MSKPRICGSPRKKRSVSRTSSLPSMPLFSSAWIRPPSPDTEKIKPPNTGQYCAALPRMRAYCTDPPSPANSVVNERSEEHTSELQSLMRISYAVFCLKKKKNENIMCKNQRTKSRTLKYKETTKTKTNTRIDTITK